MVNMSNKKARKKKKPHKPNANGGRILQNSLKNIIPDVKFIWKDDGNKLSDVISDFAGPLLEKCLSFKNQEKMLSLVILVWNMCVVPQKEADKLKEDLHEGICKGDNQSIKDMDEIMGYLIARKKRLYKDDRRFIVSYNITNTKNGLHLEVAYPTESIE